jgi:hypothetical protein
MEERAGRHHGALLAFSRIFSEMHADRAITLEQVPEHAALLAKEIGAFLKDPGA